MKTIFAALAIMLFAGCATVGDRVLLAGTTGAVRFSPEDVDAAIVIAQQTGDKVAEACYRAIRRHTDAPADLVTRGVVSTYASARAKVRESRAGLSEDVHVACAPLVVDAGSFASRFAATLAGVP